MTAVHALAPPAQPMAAAPAKPSVIGARTFLQRFTPLETVIDGLPVPRGGIVSVTGPTGSGKTTLCALLQTALRTGANFAGREVTQGSVLVLAGENPDDYAMHLLATVQHLGLTPGDLSSPVDTIGMFVVPGTFDVLGNLDHLDEVLAGTITDLVAVFVDTSAAFFTGEEENDNVAMRRHASILRELATLPGKPTVFVLCHPTKGATRDGLVPRGGGAFLNEIDANLTVWKDDAGIVTLHHAGKIRGPSFDPIRFELVQVELEGHKDCRGRPIYSTAAKHLPDERAEQIEAKAMDDENRVMVAMQRKPGGSVAELAIAAGMTTGAGLPQKSRVFRLLQALADQSLAKKDRRGVWSLTTKGKNEADLLP
jgi:energy-coupling factor transporter ATP-binding protein EcfA2